MSKKKAKSKWEEPVLLKVDALPAVSGLCLDGNTDAGGPCAYGGIPILAVCSGGGAAGPISCAGGGINLG